MTWTIETLKEHFDQRFKDNSIAIIAALKSQEKAVATANKSLERRFEGVNEFRATLSDQQRTFIPRSEVEVLIRGLDERVDLLAKKQINWGAIGLILGVIIAAAGLMI